MKILQRFLNFTVLFSVVAVSGCAYRFGPNQRQLPGGAKRIYVKMFDNKTPEEVGIEVDFTNSFATELARSGVATVTSNKQDAELVFEGTIHTISYMGATSTQTEVLTPLYSEYRTSITIVVRVVDKDNKEVWQGQFLGEKNYKAPQLTVPGLRTANPLYNQSARRQIVRTISQEMASEAVGRLTENF